jgi:hypothetical protein
MQEYGFNPKPMLFHHLEDSLDSFQRPSSVVERHAVLSEKEIGKSRLEVWKDDGGKHSGKLRQTIKRTTKPLADVGVACSPSATVAVASTACIACSYVTFPELRRLLLASRISK